MAVCLRGDRTRQSKQPRFQPNFAQLYRPASSHRKLRTGGAVCYLGLPRYCRKVVILTLVNSVHVL